MRIVGRSRELWELWKLCPWCKGTRVFSPALPMTCPVCNGTGLRKEPKK